MRILLLGLLLLVGCVPNFGNTPLSEEPSAVLLRPFQAILAQQGIELEAHWVDQEISPNNQQSVVELVSSFLRGDTNYCPVQPQSFFPEPNLSNPSRFLVMTAHQEKVRILVYDRSNPRVLRSAKSLGTTQLPLTVQRCNPQP